MDLLPNKRKNWVRETTEKHDLSQAYSDNPYDIKKIHIFLTSFVR